jgi:UDP-GlcNAc:undecaprenyl-phosphate GlcNAc-1-phosphate transferase
MKGFVFTFVLATALSAALTPLVLRIALRLGAVSRPGGRNVNERAIPRLGGLSIFVAFWVPLIALLFIDSTVAGVLKLELRRVLGLAAGALVMCGLGLVDDLRRLRALQKLAVQILAAAVAFAAGFRIEAVVLPLLGPLQMGIFALPVTVAWIVGIVNAINLIDGLDGLAAGVVFFAGVTNFIVANMTDATMVATITASMLGAVLGFWFFNFNPARIFMGDSGSYFLGFVLGTLSLAGASQKTSTAVSLLVPVIALGLPIVDTLFSMLRRVLERRSIFSPDRGHIHHRLLDMGVTHRRAVLSLYGVCIVFAAASIAVSLGRRWTVGAAILAASVVLIGIVRFVGYFEYVLVLKQQRARLLSHDVEAFRAVVPPLIRRLTSCITEQEIWTSVDWLRREASIGAIEIGEGSSDVRVERWGTATEDDVAVTFPLGAEDRARATIRIHWRSESGSVSPQAEILLQVVADALAAAMERVGSRYAAARVEPLRPRVAPTAAPAFKDTR